MKPVPGTCGQVKTSEVIQEKRKRGRSWGPWAGARTDSCLWSPGAVRPEEPRHGAGSPGGRPPECAHTCLYVLMHVQAQVCIYTPMCRCSHVCACSHRRAQMCPHTSHMCSAPTCACACSCTHAHMSATHSHATCTHTCADECAHPCVRMCTHIGTCMHSRSAHVPHVCTCTCVGALTCVYAADTDFLLLHSSSLPGGHGSQVSGLAP